jgi:hypothetical protein
VVKVEPAAMLAKAPEHAELASIDKSFQDILLGVVVVVNDLGHALAQER